MRSIINNVRIYRPFNEEGIDQIYHIEIENGTIKAIRKGLTRERGAHVHDGKERVAIPAFNDSHMHLLRYGIIKRKWISGR